jgi:hypothetical protein
MAHVLPVYDKMWNGGKIGDGYFDGYPEMDFGAGMKSAPIGEIGNALGKMTSFPIAEAVSQSTNAAVGQSQASINIVNDNSVNAPSQTNNTAVAGNGDARMPSPNMDNGTRASAYA